MSSDAKANAHEREIQSCVKLGKQKLKMRASACRRRPQRSQRRQRICSEEILLNVRKWKAEKEPSNEYISYNFVHIFEAFFPHSFVRSSCRLSETDCSTIYMLGKAEPIVLHRRAAILCACIIDGE